MHGEDSIGELLDRYSGMATERQIRRVMHEEQAPASEQTAASAERAVTSDAKAIADFISSRSASKSTKAAEELKKKIYYADVNDIVYRVFNMTTFRTGDSKEVNMRVVVLGKEGNTLRFVARGSLASYIDAQGIERGDKVLIRKSLINIERSELKSISDTTIVKLGASESTVVQISNIDKEMRNVDILGKVAAIYPIRYISRENGASIATSRITITDSGRSMDASLWGSSAIATAAMNPNDYVKLEFCTVRERYGRLEIYANDLSRVLVTRKLAGKAER